MAASPIRSVETARAESRVSGSNRFILLGSRLSASMLPTPAAGESARKMKSNFPRSEIFATFSMWAKLLLAFTSDAGWRQLAGL